MRYARFAPIGERGFFCVSRALRYGIVDSVLAEQQKLNTELSLLAQIETEEALERLEEIASVPDVDIFIGPADLAASLGVPGQTSHPELLEAAEHIVRVARKHGKKIITACGARSSTSGCASASTSSSAPTTSSASRPAHNSHSTPHKKPSPRCRTKPGRAPRSPSSR